MAASGATRLGGGGDVRVLGKTRLECKFTEKDTYNLRFLELAKVRKQAIKALEKPVLQFSFRHTSGRLRSYAVIPWDIEGNMPPQESTHSWFTSKTYIPLTESQLEKALLTGRIQFTFVHAGKEPIEQRIFEILRWSDYIEQTMLKKTET